MGDIARALRDLTDIRLFMVGNTGVTVASVLAMAAIMLVTFWLSRVLQKWVERGMTRGGLSAEGTVSTAKRLLHYAILAGGLALALQTVGIPLATVFAASAVVAVAIGFALQNILQNFVSGLILLAERSITEADILEVDGNMIRVERMGMRATVARTREDEQLIIPNTILVQSTVKNTTLSDNIYRVRTRVGVAYSSDMGRVEKVLERAARAVPGTVEGRGPVVLLLDFADSSVVWDVSVWATDPWAARVTRSDLNKHIWREFKADGITIAFPQLDVHFDPDFTGSRPALAS
ncbi:MAG TPA: mechanosensitive ion channel domain-containing protein [Longimicrobiales bacterium]|jgi:small-conductance mechanosensitive channel